MVDAVVVGAYSSPLAPPSVRSTWRSWWGNRPIRTDPGGPAWRQTTFHPFALTSRHGRGAVPRVEATGPAYETRGWATSKLDTRYNTRRRSRIRGGPRVDPLVIDVDVRAFRICGGSPHRGLRRRSGGDEHGDAPTGQVGSAIEGGQRWIGDLPPAWCSICTRRDDVRPVAPMNRPQSSCDPSAGACFDGGFLGRRQRVSRSQ